MTTKLTTTLPLTYDQIHVVMDALTRHAVAMDSDGKDDPTRIYEGGVFPDGHPLRIRADYRELIGELLDTFNGALGASVATSKISLTIEG